MCPRCNRPITNPQGVCTNCGETALQCPHCHNINYDKPDSFICNECGYPRLGKIDISVSAKLGYATQKIANEREKASIQSALSNALAQTMRSHEVLSKNKSLLSAIIRSSSIKSGEKPGKYKDLIDIYMGTCVPEYKKLLKQLRTVNSLKSELIQYACPDTKPSEQNKLEPSRNCYGCAELYLQVFLKFVELSAYIPICCKYYSQMSIHSFLISNILPCISAGTTKLIERPLVTLAAQDITFAKVIIERAMGLLAEFENGTKSENQQRQEAIFSIDLLIQLHSKLALIIIQKIQCTDSHHNIYAQTNSCLWQILMKSYPIKKVAIAELIINPLLDYVTQLLSLPCPRNLVFYLYNFYIGSGYF